MTLFDYERESRRHTLQVGVWLFNRFWALRTLERYYGGQLDWETSLGAIREAWRWQTNAASLMTDEEAQQAVTLLKRYPLLDLKELRLLGPSP